MSGKTYGYVRVSTRGQKEDRQLIAMREFGIPPERIVVEKQSGKDFERPVYLRLVHSLERGDVLVVKSIDRLGRNYAEILEQWGSLTKEKRVAIVVLDMPLLDTREERDLTGVLVADIVLQLLSYVAQTEREYLRQRQAHRGGQGAGGALWPGADRHAGGLRGAGHRLGPGAGERRPGRAGAGDLPDHLQAPGPGVGEGGRPGRMRSGFDFSTGKDCGIIEPRRATPPETTARSVSHDKKRGYVRPPGGHPGPLQLRPVGGGPLRPGYGPHPGAGL